MEKLISIKNLGVAFNQKPVLKNITFDINQGDILAVIGPNGSGKTLLIRSILGLNENYTGEIVWHHRPETSYVPQKMAFEKGFPLTVKEFFLFEIGRNLSFWKPSLKMENEIKKRLDEVKIGHLIDHRLGDLSQGEVQRMFIARSLLEQPKLIFFDEPAAGIDISTEATVYQLLYDIHQKNGLTMVLVSHELSVVYRFATKVVCLNKDLICQGVPQEVLTPEALKEIYGHHHTSVYKHAHNFEHDHTS
ncbi:MAG: metal ABC transporter ATP-binding protein [Parcubacteria group bacterium]|nr:metal ABC transporter ATP-binding protein [Parcubacteria group bacterium]